MKSLHSKVYHNLLWYDTIIRLETKPKTKEYKTVQIGKIQFAAGGALAPMAGFTDAACRRLAAQNGAIYTVSEMVSARALMFGDRKTAQLIENGENAAPYGLQLFGADAESIGKATALVQGYKFDFLDINMGCPAPKIVSTGAGSKLMLTPKLCGELVAVAVKENGDRPVTVKIRTGWDAAHVTCVEVAKYCEDAGAAAIAVHGRTREEMYTPDTVSLAAIKAVKEAVCVPVLGNGDIETAADALAMMEQTGCDSVMVGRGALGNPWLFAEISAAIAGETPPTPPTLRQKMAALRQQVYEMCEEKGERTAMPQARGQTMHYMKGMKGAAALRRACCELEQFTDIDRLIEQVYEAGNR